MIRGLSGPLFSHDVVERIIGEEAVMQPPHDAWRRLRAWHAALRGDLGPSCGARRVHDLIAEPLVAALGFDVLATGASEAAVDALLLADGRPAAAMSVGPWGASVAGAWRHAVHLALAHGTRWCLAVNGSSIRLFDASRAYARRYAEFDIRLAIEVDRTFRALWILLRMSAAAEDTGETALGRLVAESEQHRTAVRVSLRDGVREALVRLVAAFRAASRRHSGAHLLDESLIVVYRILFLLFAEARGLVPRWHPIYRDAYTVEALAERLQRAQPPSGVWEAIQAISRLAHRGCRAGALRVPPFNGRLFSPSDAPLAESMPLDDRMVAAALVSLTTRQGQFGRERISYGDLGVEQLGGIYENLLDFDVADGTRHAPVVLVPTGRRKATGAFYTPRSLTDFLVRRTLAPLAAHASSARILELRVLDPAMGSGAFLVSACRYLALAYEQALIREGALAEADVESDDRAGFRRLIAQRCLFGVDSNPMAVQLGRLSLWLATLAADRPLTFLDHRLRAGNSLAGGSVEAMARQPVPGRGRRKERDMPLLAGDDLQASLEHAVAARRALAQTPDDTLEQVRGKERALAALNGPKGPVERWRTAADFWCAGWYGKSPGATTRGAFNAVVDHILGGASALPTRVAEPILAQAKAIAQTERFFHWPFEFPEVFFDDVGAPLHRAGFDAIVGNPPWEMLRGDRGGSRADGLLRFTTGSGVYSLQGGGHVNLYQLFVERTLQLLKEGGRAGMILPSGLASDVASAPLRRRLFDGTVIDTFTIVENRDSIFPIHRGLKFLLLTLSSGGATAELPVRTGVRSADALDAMADTGPPPGVVHLPRPLLERVGGPELAVPEIRDATDLSMLARIAFSVPASASADGWGIHFGRELNATEDGPHFSPVGPGLPVVEGKQLRPFGVNVQASRYRIARRTAAALLRPGDTFARARLGYREVAASTNRMTLIAAIVPAGVVTTHTVFCLREPLDEEAQHYLCGVFNSYVANYLVRMRVGTHVTAAVLARLPVPRPPRDSTGFREVAALSRRLHDAPSPDDLARLNARVADVYGLTPALFAHVLETFPLVPQVERSAALVRFATADDFAQGRS